MLITTDGDSAIPTTLLPDTTERICKCPFVTAWYTQNYDDDGSNLKIRPYPIGLDLHTTCKDMLTDADGIATRLAQTTVPSKKMKIFCDFTESSHDRFGGQRKLLLQLLKSSSNAVTLSTRVSRPDVWKMYAQHEFVVSPPGNGLDCHRTWEVLVLGSVPVLMSSKLDVIFSDLPVIILHDWNEIQEANLQEWLNQVKDKRKCVREKIAKKMYPFTGLWTCPFLISPMEGIPKLVWTTAPVLSHTIRDWLLKMRDENPDYDVVFLSDDAAYEFLTLSFNDAVVQAFKSLRPGAFKADLLRYCLLYKYGGIYIDIKHKLALKLHELYSADDVLVLTDDWGTGVQISFMVTRQSQPVFADAIYKVVENVRTQYYGNHFLEVTGPIMFKKVLDNNKSQKYRMPYEQTTSTIRVAKENGADIIQIHALDIDLASGGYVNPWNDRNIYSPVKISPKHHLEQLLLQ